ncbi:MAG: hydroxymethylglutaryl-CoA lyase [Ferrimicrobium sp.]
MVDIVDVGPRDGLQNESGIVSTLDKVFLVEELVAAGIQRVEAVSFVDPKRVPQMADAEGVAKGLSSAALDRAIGLVLNERGLDRAIAAHLQEINFAIVVTDTFAKANQNSTTEGLMAAWRAISLRAKAAGLRTSVTLSAAFGCPFEGEVEEKRVFQVVEGILDSAPDEIALADTIGAADPRAVRSLVRGTRRLIGEDIDLRCHFHNTRNAGITNAWVALEEGVSALDASVGGIGGCPFAPNATGNIATEDLVWMLERSGVPTGVDLDRLLSITAFVESTLGHSAPSMLSKAGPFPTA